MIDSAFFSAERASGDDISAILEDLFDFEPDIFHDALDSEAIQSDCDHELSIGAYSLLDEIVSIDVVDGGLSGLHLLPVGHLHQLCDEHIGEHDGQCKGQHSRTRVSGLRLVLGAESRIRWKHVELHEELLYQLHPRSLTHFLIYSYV